MDEQDNNYYTQNTDDAASAEPEATAAPVTPVAGEQTAYSYGQSSSAYGATYGDGGQTPPNYGQPGYGAPGYGQPTGYNVQNIYEIPPEVRKWNWGAFMFNWIWGIGNKAYLSLLCLVPCLNIVWVFICGALGNRWAWKSGEFRDLESFLQTQRTWNRAGLVYFILIMAIVLIYVLLFVVLGFTIWSAAQDGDFQSWLEDMNLN